MLYSVAGDCNNIYVNDQWGRGVQKIRKIKGASCGCATIPEVVLKTVLHAELAVSLWREREEGRWERGAICPLFSPSIDINCRHLPPLSRYTLDLSVCPFLKLNCDHYL